MILVFLTLLQIFSRNEKAFEIELKNYLSAKLSSYQKYEYEIKSMPENFYKINIDEEREFKLNKKYAFVPVKIYDKKNNVSNSFITLKIRLFQNVLTAKKNIYRNEQLNDEMLEKKLIDVTGLKGKPISDYNLIKDKRIKISIRKGAILLQELIEPIPDVNFNEKLILHAGNNGVDISTEVTAREEGRIGDVIRVITRDNKIFKAKVIDKYNVTLIE